MPARSLILGAAFAACLLCQTADDALVAIQKMLQAGDIAAARTALQSAVKRYPKEPAVYNFLGVVEARQDRYRPAEDAFRTALRLHPGYTGAALNLSRLYVEHSAEDPVAADRAAAIYGGILKREPSHPEANVQMALLLERRGAFVRALEHLGRLPNGAAGAPRALALRLAAQAGLGQPAAARLTARALAEHPELSEPDVLPALDVPEAHRFEDARGVVLEALARRALATSEGLNRLGLCYEAQDRLPEARRTLEQAAQAAGQATVPALFDLARVAYKQRDWDGTLGYLAHARDLEPRNPGVHLFFGMTAIELNLGIEAEKSLGEAVRLDPANAYAHYALGAVRAQLRRYDDALASFERYCALKPADPRGRLAVAAVRFSSGDDERARGELEPLASVPATAARAHYYLGRIAMRAGETGAALAHFRAAVDRNPSDAESYAEIGAACLQDRDNAAAETALRRALQLDPDNYRANLGLLTLYQRTRDSRAAAQAVRFKQLEQKRFDDAKALLRSVEVRPY